MYFLCAFLAKYLEVESQKNPNLDLIQNVVWYVWIIWIHIWVWVRGFNSQVWTGVFPVKTHSH